MQRGDTEALINYVIKTIVTKYFMDADAKGLDIKVERFVEFSKSVMVQI